MTPRRARDQPNGWIGSDMLFRRALDDPLRERPASRNYKAGPRRLFLWRDDLDPSSVAFLAHLL